MKICFLMYTWEQVKPDTTLRLVHEAALRGHPLTTTRPAKLTIRDNISSAFCNILVKGRTLSDNITSFSAGIRRMAPMSSPLSINKLNCARLQCQVIDFDGNVIEARNMVEQRKSAFRKVIKDADAV